MSLTIRTARQGDCALIAAFNAALALETESRQLDASRLEEGVCALLADPDKGSYFIAERAGEGVGQLLITREWSDWRNGWFWWIQSVYVREDCRRQGVYRALFQHIHELARAQPEVCGLRLYMDSENIRARAVYERLGMRHAGYEVFELEFTS